MKRLTVGFAVLAYMLVPQALQAFMKYNGRHSDEIFTAHLDLAKN